MDFHQLQERARGVRARYAEVETSRYGRSWTTEEIMLGFDGRPHWGKMHTLGAEELRARYPRFDDFLALRDRLDPERLFRNPYLDRVLGG